MQCPECLTRSVFVRRLNERGLDPNLEEWECSNTMCKLTFYTVKRLPPFNPPTLPRERKQNGSQLTLIT